MKNRFKNEFLDYKLFKVKDFHTSSFLMDNYKSFALLLISFVCLISISCFSRPNKKIENNHFNPPLKDPKPEQQKILPALWFTSTNFSSGGYLGRLDLLNGHIEHKIIPVGSDTILIPDQQTNGLFLLNRIQPDGIGYLSSKEKHITQYYTLPERGNAQYALRDHLGRVWVTQLNSNEVLILSSDLKEKLATIDLSLLANSTAENHLWTHLSNSNKSLIENSSKLADLGPMLLWDQDTIWIGALRLNRDEPGWPPHPWTRIAEINLKTLALNKYMDLPISNPILFAKSENSSEPKGVLFTLIGRGDFTQPDKVNGRILSGSDLVTFTSESTENGVITAADLNPDYEKPFIIVWYPLEHKSCIQNGLQKIICDGDEKNNGYVFNSIRSQANLIFVSFLNQGYSEIWILTLKKSFQNPENNQFHSQNSNMEIENIQKIEIDLPVFSLSFGL